MKTIDPIYSETTLETMVEDNFDVIDKLIDKDDSNVSKLSDKEQKKLQTMIEGELEAAIVLSIPTIAPMFYTAILKHDIYVAGSFLLVYGIMLLIGNILADLCLAWLDPRVSK